MYKQYIKQALRQLKENKLLSFISVIGTAMAIAMIMVMVITQRIELEDYSPEVNRHRTLYVKWMRTYWNNDPTNSTNGPMSLLTAKECFKELTTPEAVCIYSPPYTSFLASAPEGESMKVDVLQTDEAFWKVFEFPFINGKPYDLADCESGITKAVIAESVARKLYGTIEAIGRTISLNHSDYTVVAVVKDISKLAPTAYAQVWIPFSTTNIASITWSNTMGMMRVAMLARSSDDFPAIREEAERYRIQFNERHAEQTIDYRGQPDDQFVYNHRKWANPGPDITRVRVEYVVVIVLLLLVPAINLSGMTLSRMRKRFPELGVRRSFGASRGELLKQILAESMILTLIGGVVGLLLSYGAVFVLNDLLFSNSTNSFLGGSNVISAAMLMDPMIFVGTFLFCLILNLLSSGVPAWRASRLNIVTALNS
ncbi:ABC transporter permease [Bacteroides sp. 51]|uniref:ABC transporter permease n=1 Tax=Bacteroides sp. 51 TaxID=2302938 RepID=UPI0013D4E774|nr:ABC transporter permease [Bacteroides sp. 51]NDV81865.1 ABC transporter permease [Bacteroides sp. 51]